MGHQPVATTRRGSGELWALRSPTSDGELVRKLVFHIQTTLNSRIADADGGFWEPFPWGEEETAHLNEQFRRADTWVMGRVTYEAIVPYWDGVADGRIPDDTAVTPTDREFAAIQHGLAKVVFSTTLPSARGRTVLRGDLAVQLAALKRQPGTDILLSCGPKTLGPLADTPGLVDEYLLAVNPAVLPAGPGVFDGLTRNLTLQLVTSSVFDAGALLLRYKVSPE